VAQEAPCGHGCPQRHARLVLRRRTLPYTCEAVGHALEMIQAGADVVDVGGESTRPGSDGVDETIEIERIVPVIAELTRLRPGTPVSVDTSRAGVAEAALAAGASS